MNTPHCRFACLSSTLPVVASFAWIALATLACTAALGGCGDEDGTGTQENPATADAGGGDDAGSTPPALLSPPKAGHGVQFTMTTHIPAGQEREHCQFMRTDEELIVNHDEVRFTPGSHHFLLFTTSYDEVPDENLFGDSVDTSGVFDCTEGVQGFWDVTGLVAMSQSADGDSAISFPEGVGFRVPAGSILLANAHYINVAESDLDPEVAINLHTIDEDELEQEGGLLFWYNPFLKVPASGASVMRASCPVGEDIEVTNIQSHMHRRGVAYEATLIDPDGARSSMYTSDTWEEVPVEAFMPNLAVSAGSRIEWQCEYQNSDSHDVYQGPRSSDEMCMLIGSYYPRNDEIGFCAQRGGAAFLGADWEIGEGTASCSESFGCIVSASATHGATGGNTTGSASQALTSAITDCLLASQPELSAPVSQMLGCLASTPEDDDPLSACAAEIDACNEL